MSAFLHQLSPQSKGLFRATIIQSGITTVPFVKSDKHPAYYTRYYISLKNTLSILFLHFFFKYCSTLAKAVGCFPDVPSHTLLTCLHMVDPEKLYLTGLELFTTFGYIPNPFKPSLDNGTSVPFLPKEPWELMTSGEFSHVPSIQGYNELDGAMFTSLYARDPTLFKETKDNFEGMASLMMYQRFDKQSRI